MYSTRFEVLKFLKQNIPIDDMDLSFLVNIDKWLFAEKGKKQSQIRLLLYNIDHSKCTVSIKKEDPLEHKGLIDQNSVHLNT